MPQVPLVWEQIDEFHEMAVKIIDKYPERFGNIDPNWIVAYGCTNKEKPEKNTKPYEMSGEAAPESFTNSKKYFVKFFMDFWEGRDENSKLWLVCSALSRIDTEHPESGKVNGFDYKDQGTFVRTLGPDWHEKNNLPNLLKENVQFVDA